MNRLKTVNQTYLSSYMIIVQVERSTSVVSFLQFVDKPYRLLLSELDVITASSPLPVALSFLLFSCLTAPTSGYSVLSALHS